jgi:hypothetical protein
LNGDEIVVEAPIDPDPWNAAGFIGEYTENSCRFKYITPLFELQLFNVYICTFSKGIELV